MSFRSPCFSLVCRCLGAMAVAHAEALLAILDACADEEVDAFWACQLLGGISFAVIWGPRSVATDPRLRAAVARCLARVPLVRSWLLE